MSTIFNDLVGKGTQGTGLMVECQRIQYVIKYVLDVFVFTDDDCKFD